MVQAVIRRRKLYEEVADHLERMIHDGDYAPSDQLPSERDLMREFGVGRPPIREALFHLRKMGLVEIRSGERARVTQPTPQFVIDALAGTARHMLVGARRRAELPGRARLLRGRPCPPRRPARDATRISPSFADGARGQPPVDRRSQALRADRRRLPLCAGRHPEQPDLHRDPCRARRMAAGAAPDDAGRRARTCMPMRRTRRSSRPSPRAIPTAPKGRCGRISTTSRAAIPNRRGARQ